MCFSQLYIVLYNMLVFSKFMSFTIYMRECLSRRFCDFYIHFSVQSVNTSSFVSVTEGQSIDNVWLIENRVSIYIYRKWIWTMIELLLSSCTNIHNFLDLICRNYCIGLLAISTLGYCYWLLMYKPPYFKRVSK